MATDPTAAAEQRVRDYCGWHVAPSKQETLVLRGNGADVLMLPSLHVTAVSSVSVDYGSGPQSLVENQDYTWDPAGWITLLCGRFPNRSRAVTVELEHGLAVMPDSVQDVIDRVASRTGVEAGALVRVGQVQYATGDDGLPLSGTLTEADKADLAHYKLPPRP